MAFLWRVWHPFVTLVVLAMAIGSAATGNALDATLFLFAVAFVNVAIVAFEFRRRSRAPQAS